MHLRAKPPIFVPEYFRREIEQMSKAALMDMAWDYATSHSAGNCDAEIMAEFRKRRDVILIHRDQA